MVEAAQKRPRVFVIGNGMTRFYRPGKHDYDYHNLAEIAQKRALRDANIDFKQIQQAYVGYVYGDSTSG
jgi:acetyl-CoA acyltransferase